MSDADKEKRLVKLLLEMVEAFEEIPADSTPETPLGKHTPGVEDSVPEAGLKAKLGAESSIPIADISPASNEEVFLLETADKLAGILNAPDETASRDDDAQAFACLYSLLASPATYAQFFCVWQKMNATARAFFRLAYQNAQSLELSTAMKRYLHL